MLAYQVDGGEVTTIEGLSKDGALSKLQLLFKKHHALQCGFCTPGMLTTAHALLTHEPQASRERITEVLSGNLCRCTGYINIIDAVCEARQYYK
jgi:carbon-monoxide dehydrogenase small subunit